jgi:lysophospholipase L1-like esterase
LKRSIAALASAALFVALLEVLLRAFPSAIPLALLAEFNPSVRSVIAKRRSLQRAADTVQLPRSDGGPLESMWLYRGDIDVTQAFDEPGIVKTMHMDRRGFCNPNIDAYEAERIDVAALGDSFTWCTNVEPRDAWPSVLERRTGLRTYNFGVPARGLYEYLQILEQFGLAKSPRWVILAVYEGNDLRDAVRYHQAKGSPVREEGECAFGVAWLCRAQRALLFGFAGEHSYVVNLLCAAALQGVHAWKRSDIDFQYEVALSDGSKARFNTRNGDLNEVTFATQLRDGSVGLWVFDDALRRFVELSREHGFVPIVIYIPSAYTGYSDLVRFDNPELEGAMRTYSTAQRRYFAEQARRLGYQYRDITPALRHAAHDPQTPMLYFRSNVHLTRQGHAVVAEEVGDLIGRLRLEGSGEGASKPGL